MGSVSLGPLAFPLAPLLLLMAYGVATLWARRVVEPAKRAAAESVVWWGLAAGLVAARAVHVAMQASDYAAHPWAVLDLRDAGFVAAPGLVVGLGVAAWRLSRWPSEQSAARRKVATAVILTAGLWWFAGALVEHRQAAQALPLAQLPVRLESLPDASGRVEQHTVATVVALAPVPPRRVVVNLWASWCGPCRAEMPLLAQAQQRHPDVLFVFVNQGESAEAIQRYLGRERLTLQQVWRDASNSLGAATGANSLPTTLVYDASGTLIRRHVGALNAPGLAALLQ